MRIFAVFSLLLAFTATGQYRTQLWLSAGVKAEPLKNWEAGASACLRLNMPEASPATLYEEFSLKYGKIKWLKPSLDYRFISDWDKNGNVDHSHRLNANLDFRSRLKPVRPGVRIRYQQLIGNFVLTGTDLDPAFRIKPYILFMPQKGKIQPTLTAEFFYNPIYGPVGQRFNRVRIGLSAEIDLKGPHTVEVTYYYGKRFNSTSPLTEHLITLDYNFEWKKLRLKRDKKTSEIDSPAPETL